MIERQIVGGDCWLFDINQATPYCGAPPPQPQHKAGVVSLAVQRHVVGDAANEAYGEVPDVGRVCISLSPFLLRLVDFLLTDILDDVDVPRLLAGKQT
jgi:hypothetical protein